ncbi:LiaF domain-containing protein [Eisenibacter elegans]|jgi:hypothetical protein|uniref:LiaF domain-containing protein n=1 Tax=Eisenibacter elegans TaxID=997 RepID=UPI000403A0B0|nr:LiaF domain-containing protein [Eisenibacter elegans]
MATTYGLPKKREEVIEVLQQAFNNQNLEEEEYERRLKEANSARSVEDLTLVVFDFPHDIRRKLFPESPLARTANTPTEAHLPQVIAPQEDTALTVMVTDTRQFAVLNEGPMRFTAIMATQKLDFRQAEVIDQDIHILVRCWLSTTVIDLRNEALDGRTLHINIHGALGEVKVMLPPGITVNRAVNVIGGDYTLKDHRRSWMYRVSDILQLNATPPPQPAQLTVNITGRYWFGSVRLVY